MQGYATKELFYDIPAAVFDHGCICNACKYCFVCVLSLLCSLFVPKHEVEIVDVLLWTFVHAWLRYHTDKT